MSTNAEALRMGYQRVGATKRTDCRRVTAAVAFSMTTPNVSPGLVSRVFVRNVAAVFDAYWRRRATDARPRFSSSA